MPELTHDPAEDGFHEIQLSGKQLLFLAMAITVVSVVIFICGVLVGRNVRASADDAPDTALASNTTQPPAVTDAPPSTEPPSPPPADELSYHRRLEGAPAAETLKPQPTPEAAKPEPTKPPAAAATPPAAAPAQQASTPAPTAADVPTSGRRGRWVIQLTALSNRARAAEIVRGLVAKGYPAFLLDPARGTPQLYRIQVGRYDDRAEADRVARRLAKEEQFKPEIKR